MSLKTSKKRRIEETPLEKETLSFHWLKVIAELNLCLFIKKFHINEQVQNNNNIRDTYDIQETKAMEKEFNVKKSIISN